MDRSGRGQEEGGDEAGLSTREMAQQLRRMQDELRRRRTTETGNARLAEAQENEVEDPLDWWGEEGEEELPGEWSEETEEAGNIQGAGEAVAHVALELIGEVIGGEPDPAMMGLLLPREKEELGLCQREPPKKKKQGKGEGGAKATNKEPYYTVRQDPLPPSTRLMSRWERDIGIVKLPNDEGVLTIEGVAPRVAIVDTGANRMILGRAMREQLGRKARPGKATSARLGLAEG